VLPFSKRPPPPDEYLLRSGDFEAVRQDSYSGASVSHGSHASYAAPRAPAPAPAFTRQAAYTPYSYAQQQQQQTYGSGQFGDLSAPPPPNSLAPMAMGAMSPDSTGRNFAQTTSRTGSIVVREKPSIKWGVMIALTGALLGGVLGLGMDARRQNARAAAAAADARDNAPPAMVAAALPNALTATPRPAPAPAPSPIGGTVIAPPPAPAVLAMAAPIIVAPSKSEVAPKSHVKAPAPKGHLFAAKVQSQPKPAPEKAERADPPEPKIAKAEKADPPEPKTKPKKDASTSDAMKILEAANKDTTNTL
jgi:hypothetical protein